MDAKSSQVCQAKFSLKSSAKGTIAIYKSSTVISKHYNANSVTPERKKVQIMAETMKINTGQSATD